MASIRFEGKETSRDKDSGNDTIQEFYDRHMLPEKGFNKGRSIQLRILRQETGKRDNNLSGPARPNRVSWREN
jgi:hypothetical protein